MSQLVRQKELIEYITKVKKAKLNDIAKQFHVNPMTIRRDLLNLEERGMLTLSRGMVILNTGTALELSPNLKSSQMAKEKKRIGKAALRYIEEGTSVFLDSGTTVKELALELIPLKNITVITNSLLVLNTLCNFSNIHLITAPGTFNAKSMSFCDTTTCNFLRNLYVDVGVFGAESVSAKEGLMVPNIDDCECKKSMIERCSKSIALADSSKMQKKSTYIFASLQQIGVLITDDRCDRKTVESFEHCGTQVLSV